jgi:hypothetical protein
VSDRDTSFNQSRDGFNVFEPTPFLPSFGSKFDKTDDDFGVSLDLTGYSVDFNQGYIFNSVSSGQVSPDYITIGNMTGHVLPLEHDNHYYVEVKLNAQNFKVNSATLTGVSNSSTGDLTNSFPHVKFDQYDAGVIEFTGYYPILRLQNGDLTEFHQRGDIVLSDRQFKQKGSFVEGTSAHVLVAENRKDDNFPVRVRAILGRSGITVTQNEDYIVLDAEAASGSGGDTGAKNIGTAVEVYDDGPPATRNPFEFRTLRGNIQTSHAGGAYENANNSVTVGLASDMYAGGSEDEILISGSYCQNVGSQAEVFVNPSIRDFKFRTLKGEDDIKVEQQAEVIVISYTGECCDLQETTDKGSTTTTETTFGSSTAIGSSPVNIVTKETGNGGATIYAHGDTTNPVVEVECDSADHGIIKTNSTDGAKSTEMGSDSSSQGTISTYNGAGTTEFTNIGGTTNGGTVSTNATDGTKSTEITSDSNKRGQVDVYNTAGNTVQSKLGADNNGGVIQTNADDGTKSVDLTSDSNNRGKATVYNADGDETRVVIEVDSNDRGSTSTLDANENLSTKITSDTNNIGVIETYNAAGSTALTSVGGTTLGGVVEVKAADATKSATIENDSSSQGVVKTFNAAGSTALTSVGGTTLGGIVQVNDTGEAKSVTVENDSSDQGVIKTFNGAGNTALTSIGGTTLGGIIQVNDTGEAKSVTVENDSSDQGVIKTFNAAGSTALTSVGGTTLGGVVEVKAADATKSATIENDSSSQGVVKTFNAAGSTALTSVGGTTLGGIIQVNDTGEAKSVTVENDSSDQGVIKTFNAAGSTALTSVGASTNGGEINVNATDDTVSVKITNDGSKRGKLEVYNAAGSTALTTIEADSSDNGKLTQKTSAGAVVNQVSADASTDTYFNSGPVGLGTSEPSAGYAVDVKGTAKVFSSSTPADGLIQLGTATNQTMGVVGGSSNFVYGAGMSSFSSDSDETLDVFTTNSAGYSAIDAYIIGSSPATGSAVMAGSGNSISGHFNVIVAGAKNLISGGTQNFIGGGTGVDIIASTYSVNVGGEDNDIVSGRRTVIGGGFRNKITGANAANIGGGSENVIEKGNYKSIGGGFQNVISGNSSSSAIAGGLQNKILGDSANYSFIGAGGSNTIKGNSQGSTIAGGVGCIISNSSASFAGGGNSIIISGSDAVALGNYSHVQQGHDGAFVFTDANTTPVLSTGKNTMVMKFESGVFVETTSGLYVNGNPVLTGETPEGDTLQTVTDRGATTTNDITISNTAATLKLQDSDGTNQFSRIRHSAASLYFYSRNDTSNGNFLFYGSDGSDNTELMRIEGGGDVGIGTNNPQSRLHIGNATGNNLGLIFTNPTETVRQYFVDDSTDSDFFITYDGNGGAEITLQHDGKLALNASNGDNVGVGTVNPRTSLHVSRAGTTEGGIITIDNPNNSDGSYCGIEFINSTVGYPRSAIFAQRTGGYDAELTFHTSPTNEITGSDYPAATERMRIDHDGNVGIGTNSPSGFSSSARRLVIGEGAASEGMSIFAGTSSNASIYFADGAAGSAAYQGFVQYKHGDSRMDFGAAGGRRMIMNGNGLLIAPNGGVFSPSAELEIASSAATLRLTDTDLTNHYSEIEKAGVYTYLSSRANAADGGFIFFGGGTDTEFMRIETDGKVGIGSASPSFVLDTVFAGDNGARLRSTDNHSSLTVQSHASYGAYLRFSDGGNRYWLQARSDDKLQFRPNASLLESACIYFDETGNVGIGVSSPSQKLEVGTNTDVSAQIGRAHVGYVGFGDYAGFAHLDNASSASYALLQSAGGDTYLNCDNGNQIFFRKNNSTIGGFNSSSDFYVDTDTLYVDASADSVGINDSSPSHALDVNGIIRTQGDNKGGGLLGTQFSNIPCTTIDGFFASTSTEDYGFQNALLMNDLAGFTKWAGVTIKTSGLYKTRGGSAGSYTYSNEAGTGDFDRAFQANNNTVGSWYSDSGPDGDITTGVGSTGVVELYFNGVKSLNYSAQAAIIFGSSSFRATHVKVEALRTGAWQTIFDTTENDKTALIGRIAGNGGGANATTGLRYSFARAGSYFRINNLYAADYDLGNDLSYGGQYYIDKYYDGRHYSTLYPVSNGESDLGTSSQRYGDLYSLRGRISNKFGIGNDALTFPLNVGGAEDTLAQFTSSDNKAGILIQDNDTAGYVSAENDKFSIGPNNGTHTGNLTIDLTNSRVGIGTNAPAYPLDVVGTIHGTSGNFENGITINGNPVVTGTSAFESDTLQTVTDQGNTTTNAVTISGALTLGNHIFKSVENSFLGLYGGSDTLTNDGFIKIYGDSANWGKVQTNIGYDATNSKAHWTLNNTTELMTLKGNGRLGIGTSDPAELLHVDGNILIPQGKTLKGYYGGSLPFDIIGMSTTTDTHIYGGNNNSSDIFFDTCNGGTTGTRMTITNAGNVGIGVTNPDRKVVIDAGAGYPLKVNSTQDYMIGLARSSTEQWWFKVNTAGDFTIHENAADDRFRIKAGGNVGIGSASPARKLDVSTNGADTYGIRNSYGASHYMEMAHNRFNAVGNNYIRFNIDDSTKMTIVDSDFGSGVNGVGIGTTSPSQKLHIHDGHLRLNDTYKIEWGGTNVRIDGSNATDYLRFFTSDTTRMTIDNNGNVGIGTTNPSAHLTIAKTDPKITLYDTAGANSDPNGEITFNETATSENFAIKYNGANDRLEFNSPLDGNTGIMVITRSERVGIGTTNPSARLDVIYGSSKDGIFVKDEAGGAVTLLGADGSNNARARFYNGSHATAIELNANAGSPTYFNAGNVGIGTSSPNKNLSVYNAGNAQVGISGTNVSILTISDPNSHGQLNTYNDGTFRINSVANAAGTQLVLSGSNVGIGTASPEQPFHVAATNYKPALIQRTAGTNCYLLLEDQNTTQDVGVGATTNDLKFRAGNSDHMKLDAGGDLFLGSPSDSADKLMVQANANYFAARLNGSTTAGQSMGLRVRAGYNSTDRPVLIEKGDGSDVFIIDGLGNVGIGSAPSYELDVSGTTRSTYYIGGAYLEENASSSKLKFYSDGTILVMDEDGELKPCEKENDALVFGVSKKDFDSPVVLGAEPVLVTGPIKLGDYIVTSNKQGHGKAMKEQNIGTIIAQAMESGDGESYNIKAMVRKM